MIVWLFGLFGCLGLVGWLVCCLLLFFVVVIVGGFDNFDWVLMLFINDFL